ncbi:MAG: elongation factor P [Patescibacteria group bacterium]|nr:elongation factor P [Patescibacteria group bacterium]
MLEMNDLKIGTIFKYRQAPHTVLKADHVQMGRGSAVLRTKIRNLITGQVFDVTFKAGDRIEGADLDRRGASYLYRDEEGLHFMDSQSYEQFVLPEAVVGDKIKYLCENTDIDVYHFEQKPVTVQIPIKVELTVVETAPGVRGDTAQGSVSKQAKLNSGATVNVPLFVKQGDVIRVNTETGQYIERV